MAQSPSLIGFLLKQLHLTLEGRRSRSLERLGLTAAQMDVLMFLLEQPKERMVSQRDIERFFHLSNPTVTGILNRLEEKGFISRQVSEADRRQKSIMVTPQGQCLHADIAKDVERINTILLEGFSPAELCQLQAHLRRMLDNLSASK